MKERIRTEKEKKNKRRKQERRKGEKKKGVVLVTREKRSIVPTEKL